MSTHRTTIYRSFNPLIAEASCMDCDWRAGPGDWVRTEIAAYNHEKETGMSQPYDQDQDLPVRGADVAARAARTEVASLCGLVLRRLQEIETEYVTPGGVVHEMARIFGEALADFSGHTKSGSAPGED